MSLLLQIWKWCHFIRAMLLDWLEFYHLLKRNLAALAWGNLTPFPCSLNLNRVHMCPWTRFWAQPRAHYWQVLWQAHRGLSNKCCFLQMPHANGNTRTEPHFSVLFYVTENWEMGPGAMQIVAGYQGLLRGHWATSSMHSNIAMKASASPSG